MGYAGNDRPQFVIPTTIATRGRRTGGKEDFDFAIGEEAQAAAKGAHALHYPIRHGQVESWDLMEAYWQHCFFRYLRCDPEEHAVLLTEPPLNAPENREYTAEIMFESFNVPHLYIAVQAVLALAASWLDGRSTDRTDNPLTGTVVDSGDGVTHIIPVVEGYAIGSAIKHIPLAGREVTHFLQQLLRDRPDVLLAPEDTMEVARRMKESLCYVCPDPAREYLKYDQEWANGGRCCDRENIFINYFLGTSSNLQKRFVWADGKNGKTLEVTVGAERFLGPEVFFSPEMCSTTTTTTTNTSSAFTEPLPALIDKVIQACPIDCRRGLYKNVVLSGGSTMFKDFDKRLQRDMRAIVEERLAYTSSLEAINKTAAPVVNVLAHRNQRYAVWSGGSLFASMEQFPAFCHSKAEYDEYGPSICRQSRVFGSLLH